MDGEGQAGPPTTITPPVVEDPQRCPSALKGVKVAVKFNKILQASVTCEAIEAKVASGTVGVFGQLKVSGPGFTKTTVMIGIQAAAEVPGTKTGVGASEGVFLEFGPAGLTDGGLKIEAKGALGLGGGSLSVTHEAKAGVTFAVVSGLSIY